jgi:hypothetical protein
MAKAMDGTWEPGAGAKEPSGVGGVERSEGCRGNWRGPRWPRACGVREAVPAYNRRGREVAGGHQGVGGGRSTARRYGTTQPGRREGPLLHPRACWREKIGECPTSATMRRCRRLRRASASIRSLPPTRTGPSTVDIRGSGRLPGRACARTLGSARCGWPPRLRDGRERVRRYLARFPRLSAYTLDGSKRLRTIEETFGRGPRAYLRPVCASRPLWVVRASGPGPCRVRARRG